MTQSATIADEPIEALVSQTSIVDPDVTTGQTHTAEQVRRLSASRRSLAGDIGLAVGARSRGDNR